MAKRKKADDTAHDWRPAPYRPHWHADFWGDSRVLNMTLEEVGCYVRLLDMHWVNGARGIPVRRDRLLKVLPALSDDDALDNVLACFTSDGAPAGRLVQKRCLEEIAKALVRFTKARAAAQARHQGREQPAPKRARSRKR
ncbi:MAG: hypothetical protein DRH08_00060 [Deltaproteobacteria bacterium]|nr:MAG: hypothetical protein DRH08_00060 [Deltaproteobacteria bacterium]